MRLILLFCLALMALLPSRSAWAQCTSPTKDAGSLERFTTSDCTLDGLEGEACDGTGSLLGLSIETSEAGCANYCGNITNISCCQYDNLSFECQARSDPGTMGPAPANVLATLCSVFISEYKLCDGTNWQTISLDLPNIGGCAGIGDIEYDTSLKSYKVCGVIDYKRVNCVTGTAPTATLTAKGTANNKTAMASWTALSSVSLNAEDTLLVCIASKDIMDTNAVSWNGNTLTQATFANNAGNFYTYIYSLSNASAGTGNIVVNFIGQTATGKALTASSVTNLKTASAVDRLGFGVGSSTAPSATNSFATTQADEFLFSCIGTNGPVGDAPGTWSNSFTNDQRTGSTGGGAATNMTANNGYRQVSATGSYTAAKTGEANRAWAATIATYRIEVPCATYGVCPKAGSRQYFPGNGMRWCAGSSSWKAVSAGDTHTCGIKSDDSVWCWGANASGQIGDNTSGTNRIIPTAVNGGGAWKVVTSGNSFTCGIKSDDSLWCWGGNATGQLGDNTSGTNRLVPVAINGGGTWKLVSAGSDFACGIKNDDTLWCWGSNGFGQIGDNTSGTNRLIPTAVNGGGTWKLVSAGSHTCGIKSDDTVWCWGYNGQGQIGDNTSGNNRLVPTAVNGGGTWKRVSAGTLHTCGIKNDDTFWCWGDNFVGQIGDNTSFNTRLIPTAVNGGGAWKLASAGNYFTCGSKIDNSLWCWGANSDGQLGDNSNTSRYIPTAVSASGAWTGLDVGTSHSCGILGNTASCWGYGGNGQLGDNTTTNRLIPTGVDGADWKQFKAP